MHGLNYESAAGAILAIGCGGRETTLWPLQKVFYDKKLVILCPQTNLTDEFREVLCQIQQVFEEGSDLFVSKSREKRSANVLRCNV